MGKFKFLPDSAFLTNSEEIRGQLDRLADQQREIKSNLSRDKKLEVYDEGGGGWEGGREAKPEKRRARNDTLRDAESGVEKPVLWGR